MGDYVGMSEAMGFNANRMTHIQSALSLPKLEPIGLQAVHTDEDERPNRLFHLYGNSLGASSRHGSA